MALGARRVQILRRFIAEGVDHRSARRGAGVLAGVALAVAISWVGIPMPPPPGMTKGYLGEIMVTRRSSWMRSHWPSSRRSLPDVYPAWKASRMNIVDALRRNR